nr:immunoglobulin light chain junction region [Macaca mulatta]MOW07829.1 immunoglobulin light chain junction region [Macaca mulatta]
EYYCSSYAGSGTYIF